MTSPPRTLALCGLCLLASQPFAACLEIEAVSYTPRTLDGGASDSGEDRDACRRCVIEPAGACFDVYQICTRDPKCDEATLCALADGCLNIPELQARIDCALPCITAAGILGNQDPALALALDVNLCSVERCADSCSPLSGGI